VLLGAIRDRYGSQPLTIISPDAGGVERARAYAKRLNANLAIIDKRREAANVSQVMNIIGDVRGPHLRDRRRHRRHRGYAHRRPRPRSRARAPRWCRPRSPTPCSRAPRSSGSRESSLTELVITDTVPLRPEADDCDQIRVVSISHSPVGSDPTHQQRRERELSVHARREVPSVPDHQLAVEARSARGKGHARKLRANGRIPAVCYAPERAPPRSSSTRKSSTACCTRARRA
jgi:hypothetical protein